MFIEVNKISPKGLLVTDNVMLDRSLLLETDSFFSTEAEYEIQLTRDGNQVRARGHIRTTLTVPCVSCLEHVELPIDSSFDIILFPVSLVDVTHTNTALEDGDMEYIFFDGDRIDIEKILLEQVNLAIPEKPLCKEDCNGLCPQCGKNMNYEMCECENSFGEVNFLLHKMIKR